MRVVLLGCLLLATAQLALTQRYEREVDRDDYRDDDEEEDRPRHHRRHHRRREEYDEDDDMERDEEDMERPARNPVVGHGGRPAAPTVGALSPSMPGIQIAEPPLRRSAVKVPGMATVVAQKKSASKPKLAADPSEKNRDDSAPSSHRLFARPVPQQEQTTPQAAAPAQETMPAPVAAAPTPPTPP